MARAKGILDVQLIFKGLSKKAQTELQMKIAKLGANVVTIRESEQHTIETASS